MILYLLDTSNGAFETTTNIAESSTAQITTVATTPTITTTTTTLCEVGCGSWTQVGETCFQVFTDKLKWNAAQAACEDFGGSLASIKSAEEKNAVKELAGGSGTWLGGNDKEKHKKWVWKADGKKVKDYTKWDKNKPTTKKGNDCMKMTSSSK